MQITNLLHQLWNFIQQLFTVDPQEPFKAGAKVAAILGVGLTIAVTLITKTYPWLRAKIESRSVSKIFGEDLFPPKSIEKAIRYYIPPSCQSIDPAGGEESRLVHSVQAPLFETFDKALSSESEEKYHILLADSGMGKTSAVTNYCVRHQRRWRKKYYVAMVPLGIPDADERIKRIESKAKTSLFLDALDEDTLAMVDHVERIRLLIKDTHEFRKVIITCRTQFFSNDEEIPKQTGVIKITVRSAGESAEQLFYKIYLAPFSDDQVKMYLKRRYPIWQWKRRKQAFRLVAKIPLLTARPMLLAHIEDLVKSDRDFHFSYELYEEMVEAWIEREKGFVEKSGALRDFSERLSVDLCLNRAKRGAERIPKDELNALAKRWGIPISDHKLSGRSLLNRDADGNYKFAHRSIMEYLVVQRLLREDYQGLSLEWTDQMSQFMWEILQSHILAFREQRYMGLSPFLKGLSNDCLRNILTFILQNSALDILGGFGKVATETMVVLCALILERQGATDVNLHLWQAFAESVLPAEAHSIGINNFYELRLSGGLSYFDETLHPPRMKVERVVLPDRAMLSDQFHELPSPWARMTNQDKASQLNYLIGYRVHGRLLVAPIFIEGNPSFVLLAESRGGFNQKHLEAASEILAASRPPSRQGDEEYVYGF